MATEPTLEPTVAQEEEEEGDEGDESDDYELEGDGDEYALDGDDDDDEDNEDEEGEPNMTAYLLGKQNGTEVDEEEGEDEEYSDSDEKGTVGNPIDLSLPTAGSKRSADKLVEGVEHEEEEEEPERQAATKKARV